MLSYKGITGLRVSIILWDIREFLGFRNPNHNFLWSFKIKNMEEKKVHLCIALFQSGWCSKHRFTK